MHGYFQQLDEAGDYSFIFIRRFIGLSNDYHSWLDRLTIATIFHPTKFNIITGNIMKQPGLTTDIEMIMWGDDFFPIDTYHTNNPHLSPRGQNVRI